MQHNKPKIVAIIPAHLASVRFPKKILFEFFGHPMIEHVRRRALLSKKIDEVYVATCDREIAIAVSKNGGKVCFSETHHKNGTSRVAEVAKKLDASHIILLQGDEPLLLPSYVDEVVDAISNNPGVEAWNGTGPIEDPRDVDKHSFVKCAVAPDNKILYCFRRSPSHALFDIQQKYMRKILGIIAFRREYLQSLVSLSPTTIEINESIEQMRIIESGHHLRSVHLDQSLPSVNEPNEIEINEIRVPIHFPNIMPDKISIGEPKPNSITHMAENIKKRMRFNIKFFPIISSIFSCIIL